MSRKNIEKFSRRYYLLKIYSRVMHYLYYGRIRVKGKSNIPPDKPLIFAPNHQNALMDALAVLFTIPGQMVFLARADIFRRSFFSSLLTFLKILPIYRIRDGYSTLQSNSEIFRKTVDVLRSNRPIVILPEGNHEGIHKLRPLKKGIARIAFQTAEACDFNLDIHIIPVGLDYSRYEKSGSELLIQYGIPIRVLDYAGSYKENPPKAINSLIAELKSGISKLMIDIQNEEYYEMIDIVRRYYSYTLMKEAGIRITPWNRYSAEIETIKILEKYLSENPDDEIVKKLEETAMNYRLAVGYNKLHFRNPEEGRWPVWKFLLQGLLFLITLPLFMAGFINNILPVLVPKSIEKRIKDVQFRSSFKFGLSILTFPFFYLLQTLLFYLIIPLPGIYTLWYLVSLPLTGLIAVRYRLFFRRYLARLRYRFLIFTNRRQYDDIRRLRAETDSLMAEVRGK